MDQVSKGYTLIELMIIITIVGLLTAIAIPFYQDYQIRTRVSEGLVFAEKAKTAVSETLFSKGAVSSQAASGFLSPGPGATENVDDITIANDGSGRITIQYVAAAGGGTILLTPTRIGNKITNWDCSGGSTLNQYRPVNCR